MARGHAWQGGMHCKGSVHGMGHALWGRACVAGGHVWQGECA